MEENEVELTDDTLKEILEKLGVSSVFGDPVRRGDVTIIPVAETKIGFGYGGGHGKGRCGPMMVKSDEDAEEEDEGFGEGTGRGYGGGGKVVPRGFIKFTPDGVSYEPIVNPTKLALAGIALAAWAIYRITGCFEEED